FQVWRGHGIEPLSNASVTLHRGADTIALAGVNDTIGAGAYAPDPEAALRGVDPGAFTLYLAHEPRQAEQVAGRGVDLQLSGHTHGGQLWPFRDLV
ncbi:metallophosphoesterase, partial [Salmonella enterica subsp. enterica serovar Oslo]|nr:metallophosphoesterase [Salmonella enterica subsp. enterica serovar Oslo]